MEETKDTPARTDEGTTHAPTREEQATSSKTLSDIEQSKTDAGTTGGGGSASDTSSPVEGSSPTPNGAGDSAGGGRADGSDTGGPM